MHRFVLVGAGEVSTKAVIAQVDDLWGSIQGDKRLVLPITGPQLGRLASIITDWAIQTGKPFELLGDDFEVSQRVYEAALRVFETKEPIQTAINGMSPSDHLLVAYDEVDPDCRRAVRKAKKVGARAFDLTSGLSELILEEEEDDLPVTMPLRDDDLKTKTEVTAAIDPLQWIAERLQEAQAILQEVQEIVHGASQMSRTAPSPVTNAPQKPKNRPMKAQQEATHA